jgi:transcriptional regulator with XRE-family HTH domain
LIVKYGTLTRLAKAANVSRQAIYQAIQGKVSFGVPAADALAEYTNTDIRLWLRGGGTGEERLRAINAWVKSEAIIKLNVWARQQDQETRQAIKEVWNDQATDKP